MTETTSMNTKLLIVWCAGFFDGDGSLSIGLSDNKWHQLALNICCLDMKPLQVFKQLFGGTIRITTSKLGKPVHRWKLTGKDAIAALIAMYPFLVSKKDAVTVGLKFSKTLLPHGGHFSKRILSKETFDVRQQLKEELEELNARD